MCIIAYVPEGIQITEDAMETNFVNNPDGAGFMWKEAKSARVNIRKGFRTVEELKREYFKIPKECEKAIHFRIATSGKISTETCHPFPIRARLDDIRNGYDVEDMAMMHNGVIPFCTPTGGMSATYSDTMLFTTEYLFKIKSQLSDKHIQGLIEHADSSRFLIMGRNIETIMLGKWEKDSTGILYSNTGFRYKKKSYSCLDYGYENDYYQNLYSNKYAKPLTIPETKTIYFPDILGNIETRSWGERNRKLKKILKALRLLGCNPKATYLMDTKGGVKFEVEKYPETKATICGKQWRKI